VKQALVTKATWLAALLAASLAVAATPAGARTGARTGGRREPASTAVAGPVAALRLDTVGYLPGETKHAYLMTSHAVSGLTFHIVGADGTTALSGSVGTASRGRWSAAYPDVYPLTFTALRAPGVYHLVVTGPLTASSPTFRVESRAAMYGRIVRNGVRFFQVQRDGADQVPGPLHRRPSHLNDAHARVYEDPHIDHPFSDDVISGRLTPVPGRATVDVEGGWFDAGDYLKFAHTAAYADVLLYASRRALGAAAPASLDREAQYGERWLHRMWHERTRTLYLQVGIGSGDRSGTYYGDHDLWRLPQADDHNSLRRDRYAARHRPVFQAAAPGHLISPNLVGRVSAAFALAAQADARTHPHRAAAELHAATSLYRMADTRHPPDPLVTSVPVGYYPETTWHDDMALGATEIALADLDLRQPARTYVVAAAHWAKEYLAHDTGDTFNLYDTSALAESDLIRAMSRAHVHHGLAVGRDALLRDLRRQIRSGLAHSAADPFRAGGNDHQFDVDSHTFGLISTVAMYDRATGRSTYQGFATAQRDWLFGANAWGASFTVGEGTNFPQCMQHQVANLSGSRDGRAPVVLGAVVNGPNAASLFTGGLGGRQAGMRKCPVGAERYQAFNGRGARYIDDVRSWQTDEPALDMSGAAVLAAALEESST
jgi:endoglucanase